MTSSYIRDFIRGQLAQRSAGIRPNVDRPSVGTPNPFDDDGRMDISDRFRPQQQDSTSPDSFYATTATGGSGSQRFYTGPINVTGMTQSVADQFVGMPKGVSVGISGTGLGTFAGIGAAISKKNLERIEAKIAAGEKGYGLAIFNGRIVGVSPGILGDDSFVFSGVLPEGLTHRQRVELRDAIMATRTPATSDAGFEATMPPPEPTDEERAAAAGSNIVYDDKGQPVKVGDTDDYVTTQSGQYVSQTELEKQNAARQAAAAEAARQERARAAEAARAQAAAAAAQQNQRDDSDRNYGRTEYSVNTSGSSNPADRGYRMNAKGGRIGMADGGSADPVQGNGFVEGSPDNYTKAQTVADDENRQVRVGSFVLNAPTTEKLQKAGVLPKGVDNSGKNTTIKANKGGMMDVALSKGEYVLEPEEAKQIGYDVLNKINDQGKPEVDRRQAMGHGGMTGTTEEIEAALTGTPAPAPTNFQNLILQDAPVELEYRHGTSEFDGSYPSLYERAVNNDLSPEAQAILFNNSELQNKLFEDMTPRIAQDNRNFMTTAESMTSLDHMTQFEQRGLDKLFPGATADQVERLTRYPYITYDDSPETLASSEFGFYRSAGDELVVYPRRIDLYLKANVGMKRDADGTLSYPFEINYADPIQEIYGESVKRTAYHELGHMAYDKMIRRNLPFSSAGLLEFSTNMYNTEENYDNFVPADILDEKASVDKKLEFAFKYPRKAAKNFIKKGSFNELRERQVELENLIQGYVPDQNHSAMMYYEIERIMDETKDLPIDKRVVARQYISERSLFYIPESRQGEIVRMRMQILRRPENKELLAALRKTDGYQIEATHFMIKPEFYARFAQKNPQLLPALDRLTEEFLTVTREIHGGYSEEFRAALNAEDVYDLPIGSSVRAAAIKNLKSDNSIKRFRDYWGSKDRMYTIPSQADLISPADYDPEYRPMIVPDSALRQFIYGPEKAERFAQDAERQGPPAPPPEPTPYQRGFLDKILGVTPAY